MAVTLLVLLAGVGLVWPALATPTAAVTGVMSPLDPLVATGDTLVVNCTLSDAWSTEMSKPSDDVFFTLGLERLPSSYVRVLDPRTAQLRWPNMTRRHSAKHLFCYWRSMDHLVSHEVITVADMPKKPNITDCRVYNWNRMVCQWEPAVQNTGIETNQTLFWTLLPDIENRWSSCTRQTANTCVWSEHTEDYLFMLLPYQVVVQVRSALTTSIHSDILGFDPSKRVEPDPPRFLNVTKMTLTLVTLTWLPPPENRSAVVFRVNHSSPWQQTPVSVIMDGLTLNLTSLVPYTNYSLTVEARPGKLSKLTGYWSQATTLTFTTPTNVPGSVPAVSDGSFHAEDINGVTEVTLYWQELAAITRHGVIKEYTVSVYCSNSSTTSLPCDTRHVSGDRLYDRWTLTTDQSYSVTVEAVTSAGRNTSLALRAVTMLAPSISTQLAVNRVRQFVAVRNRQSGVVSLSWLAPESHTPLTGYTIYWCQAPMEALLCKRGLQWLHLPANQTSYNFSVKSPEMSEQLRFASSAEYAWRTGNGSVSSGLHWSLCTYDLHRPLGTPDRMALSHRLTGDSKRDSAVLVVTWERPGCAVSGYISAFLLSYCDVTKHTCTGDGADDVVVTVATGDVDQVHYEYAVSDVVEGHKYTVRVRSVSTFAARPSPWTDPITSDIISESGSSAIIIAVSVLFVAIAGCCLALLLRYKRPCHSYQMNLPSPPPITTFTLTTNTDYRGYQVDDDTGRDYLLTNGHLRNSAENAALMNGHTHINGQTSDVSFSRGLSSPRHVGGRGVAMEMPNGGQSLPLDNGHSGGQGLSIEEETEALLSGDSNATAMSSSNGSHLALLSNRQHSPACDNSYLTNGDVAGGQGRPPCTDIAAYSQLNVLLLPNADGYVDNSLFDSHHTSTPRASISHELSNDSETDDAGHMTSCDTGAGSEINDNSVHASTDDNNDDNVFNAQPVTQPALHTDSGNHSNSNHGNSGSNGTARPGPLLMAVLSSTGTPVTGDTTHLSPVMSDMGTPLVQPHMTVSHVTGYVTNCVC